MFGSVSTGNSTCKSILNMLKALNLRETRKSLRSATNHNLALPRTHLVRYGQRSFGVACPATWNQLPTELRDPDISFDIFRKRLKTVLFSRAYYS